RPAADVLTAMTSLLSLADVSKRFGRVMVAEALSLEITDGEAVGIVGPNGAGKTTLFSIISGDLRPDAGQVAFDGRPVTRPRPAERCGLGIGRTYLVPRPFEHMTVFENVLVAVEQGGGGGAGPAARRRALGTLDYTGLLDQANTEAGRLTLLARKRLE